MNIWRTSLLILLFTTATAAYSSAADKSPLQALLQDLQAGRIVDIPDGTYTNQRHLTLQSLRGTESAPITIRAAHRGKAIINGMAGLVLKECEHVIIEGFVFENDADQQCVRLENCTHVRVTRNVFRPQERAKPNHWEHWVTVDGARSGHNRIDHNLFDHKVNRGSPLFVRGDDKELVCSQHDVIDHNHFRDVVYANRENGHETIRTGGNDLGASGRSSFTTIESNLLERCSGEDEIISLKSSDNVVRNNTLINCRGAICLRLGNRTTVTGNIILATEESANFGGVKLFGFEHTVTDNYFSGLTGRTHEAPFSLTPGMYDTPTTDNIGKKYDDGTSAPATRCTVQNNTWVDCAPLQLGWDKPDKEWPHLPASCTFTQNRVFRTKSHPKPLMNFGLTQDLQAKDNLAYSPDAKPDSPWTSAFQWQKDPPAITAPKSLTSADVGPDTR